jgi:hypothetical protein
MDDAARLINQIKPEFAVPVHYDLKERDEFERFRLWTDKNIENKVL